MIVEKLWQVFEHMTCLAFINRYAQGDKTVKLGQINIATHTCFHLIIPDYPLKGGHHL